MICPCIYFIQICVDDSLIGSHVHLEMLHCNKRSGTQPKTGRPFELKRIVSDDAVRQISTLYKAHPDGIWVSHAVSSPPTLLHVHLKDLHQALFAEVQECRLDLRLIMLQVNVGEVEGCLQAAGLL